MKRPAKVSPPSSRPARVLAKVVSRIARLRAILGEVGDLVGELERSVAAATKDVLPENSVRLPCDLDTLERAAIEAAMREVGGNRARAAVLLGISRSSLYTHIGEYAAAKALAKPSAGSRQRKRVRAGRHS
jgi:DNA-binding NtrC family response regulator